MIDSSDVLARAHGLLGPAEAALRARLAAAPDDAAMRWRLAEVLRQRGDLPAAAEALRAVLAADPGHADAARALAALEGRPIPAADGPGPAPFALVHDVLSADEQDELWAEVEAHDDRFLQSMVGVSAAEARVNADHRFSEVLLETTFPATAARFRERLPDIAREAWAARGLPPVPVGRIQLVLSRHVGGHFFKAHKDQTPGGESARRRVTFVYYFHRSPRRFSGGDLLLLDTDLAADAYTASYTRVSPDHGKMVVFPSPYFHQVTPVVAETDDPRDGRFAVTGWILAADDAAGR